MLRPRLAQPPGSQPPSVTVLLGVTAGRVDGCGERSVRSALSVPCGFSRGGLPVGLQIVGRHQDDFGLLQIAHAFESATGLWKQRPAVTDRKS